MSKRILSGKGRIVFAFMGNKFAFELPGIEVDCSKQENDIRTGEIKSELDKEISALFLAIREKKET